MARSLKYSSMRENDNHYSAMVGEMASESLNKICSESFSLKALIPAKVCFHYYSLFNSWAWLYSLWS